MWLLYLQLGSRLSLRQEEGIRFHHLFEGVRGLPTIGPFYGQQVNRIMSEGSLPCREEVRNPMSRADRQER